jgi:hypothetical protein
METLFGWLIIISIILMVVGVIGLVVQVIRKRSKKSTLIMLIVGVVLMGASIVYVKMSPSADYVVTTAAEGKHFNEKVADGEDITGKTIEAKISAVGDADPTGNYLGFATVGDVQLAIDATDQAAEIKAGDTVTVKVDDVKQVLGLNLIYSELQ